MRRDDDDDDFDDDDRPRPKKKKKPLKRRKKASLTQNPLFWVGLGLGVLLLGGGVTAAILLLSRDTNKYAPTQDPLLYKMVGHWSFDSVEGNRVRDGSSEKNDGLLMNAELVQGRKGQGLALSGRNDSYVELSNVSRKLSIPENSDFTVAAWFQTSEQFGTIVAFRHTTLPNQFGMFIRGGRGIAVVGDDYDVANNNHAFQWVNTPNDPQWHHMAVVRTGPTIEVFYDGQSYGKDVTKRVSGPLTFDMCCIGLEPMFVRKNETRFGPAGFRGIIDEVYLFHRSLSQQELAMLMAR